MNLNPALGGRIDASITAGLFKRRKSGADGCAPLSQVRDERVDYLLRSNYLAQMLAELACSL